MISTWQNNKYLLGLGIVGAVLVALLLASFHHLTVVQDRVRVESRGAFWNLSQLQREQSSMSRAFAEFQMSPGNATHQTLVDSFDVFWGRLLILKEAQETEALRRDPKTIDFAERLLSAMEWLEPSVQALASGNTRALATVDEGFKALDQEMRSFILSSYLDPTWFAGFWRDSLKFAGIKFGLAIGAIALAMVVFALLLIRAVQRAESLLRLSLDAQVAQRQSEARFRVVAEAASDWFWETDADNRLTYISDRFEEIYGRKSDSVMGLPWDSVFAVSIDEGGPGSAEYPGAIADRRSFRDLVHEDRSADGRRLVIRSSGQPFYDEQGDFAGYRGASSAITAEVEAREVAAVASEQLHQSQKLQAIGQLTGGIAHDFNNLLSVISGTAEVLRRRYGEEDEAVSTILKMAERGSRLTGRLRTFSRQRAISTDKIEVTDLLNGVGAMLEPTLGESIEITLNVAAQNAVLELDRSQLENALLNLAINARDAMPSGGHLSISAESAARSGQALPKELKGAASDYLVLAVTDNGVGIPEEFLEQIFEPFFSTKSISDGNGLGLSMVYGFVTQSGGAIDVSSKLGEGTQIRLFLPLASKSAVDAAILHSEAALSDELPPGDGQRILIVEDDDDVRSLTAKLLTFLGYKVDLAASGEEALEFVGQEVEVDLVITDMVLSGALDGLETARAIDAKIGGAPVIFMSGYPDDVLRKDHVLLEDVEILTKPFRIEELAQTVNRVLSR